MNPHWQWNHVPDDSKWSLTEKPGVLRLHSLPAANFYAARNSLCQRPPGPESIMTIELDTTGMTDGDNAGLALLSNPSAWIGLVKSTNGTTLQLFQGSGRRTPWRCRCSGQHSNHRLDQSAQSSVASSSLQLRHRPSHLQLEHRWQGIHDVGQSLHHALPVPQTFQGVRPALFNFNTSGQPGGYADFDNYTVDEPRARGIEREIPLGKTITLTSGADGSILLADSSPSNLLVNAMAFEGRTSQLQFQVVDLGLGRVAFKAGNGKFVSVADDKSVVLKDLMGKKPSDAESFQWINLMRGDTAFMSLVNHRYLATKPNQPGAVTATAADVTPARKSGVEFKWKTVD